MFEITRLTVEHLAAGCVTDCSTPRIGFSLSSDRRGAQLADAELTVGDWSAHVTSGQSAAYVGQNRSGASAENRPGHALP